MPSKIICAGRNYVAHARELGHEVPDRPLLFLKPPSSLVQDGQPIILPDASNQVEHEGEIAIIVGRRGHHIPQAEAMDFVAGFAPLNDVTARDLQRMDDQWTRAKGFDTFCPLGAMVPATGLEWRDLEVVCRVNGEARQHGRAVDMLFGVDYLLAYISRIMTLLPGDVIATGTPEGVGPLLPGDLVEVEVAGAGVVASPVKVASTA